MAHEFRTTRRVAFSETDMAGIVHFANFFRFMEAAKVEFPGMRGVIVVKGLDQLPLAEEVVSPAEVHTLSP